MEVPQIDQSQFKRLLTRAIIVPVIALMAFVGLLLWQLEDMLSAFQLVDHTDQAIAQAYETQKLLLDMETGLRGYLITGEADFLAPYFQAQSSIRPVLGDLNTLVSDNSAQLQRISELTPEYERWEQYAKNVIALHESGGDYASLVRSREGKRHMDAMRALLVDFTQAEMSLRDLRSRAAQQSAQVVVGSSIALGLVLGATLAVVSRRQLLMLSHSYGRTVALVQERANLLEEQRERLQVTLSSIGDSVVVTDVHGRITMMNGVAQSLTGWSETEARGQSLDAVFTIINEQTRLPVESPVVKVLQQGSIVGLANHTLLIRRDGAETPIDDSAAPIRDRHGQVFGVVLVFRDITERKHAEEARKREQERQSLLIETSELLASSLEYEPALERLAELLVPRLADWAAVHLLEESIVHRLAVAHIDPAKAELARSRPDHYPLQPNAQYSVAHVLASGEPELYTNVTDQLLIAAARNAEHLKLLRALGFKSYICVPLIARGRTLGVITLVTADSGRRYDDTDLRLAEDLAARVAIAVDNARLYREAQEAVRARDQFLSIASHELKTPLTSLIGYTDLIQRRAQHDGMFSERDQRAVRVIGNQSQRLNKLVTALLDLSRIQNGQLSIDRGVVELNSLVQRLIQEIAQAQPHEGNRIVFGSVPEPLVVIGDELRLEQVIQNLIQNALKYSPDGGPVTIQLGRSGDRACISVRDEGIGIPAASLQNLFQRFYRAPNVQTHQINGMGVGLFVVRKIVQLHGGEITVESEEGVGSTFTVWLPLHQDDQLPTASTQGSAAG